MRKITVIIDQLNECKKLILSNDTAALRMALILLDNAVEILMYRKTLDEFLGNEMYERILDNARSTLPPDLFDKFKSDKTFPEIIETKRKRKILQYFDEKLVFLSETCSLISEPISAVLSSLHRYRNETYHRDIIRSEILRPLAILYFEISCDLMVELKHNGMMYSSNDDWTPFYQKYNLNKGCHVMLNDEDIETILNAFRVELSIELTELRKTLQAYMNNRIDETLESLDFITETLCLNTRDDTLKLIQFKQTNESKRFKNYNLLLISNEFKNFQSSITDNKFSSWKHEITAFGQYEDKMKLFNSFSLVENDFQPIEKIVNEVAGELDAAIQFYIDLARGK